MVWYISLILILYLFFPLLYRMVAIPDRRLAGALTVALTAAVMAGCLALYGCSFAVYDRIEIALWRVVPFILGAWCGRKVRMAFGFFVGRILSETRHAVLSLCGDVRRSCCAVKMRRQPFSALCRLDFARDLPQPRNHPRHPERGGDENMLSAVLPALYRPICRAVRRGKQAVCTAAIACKTRIRIAQSAM